LKWSAIGGGGSLSACYIGMPSADIADICWVGRPVWTSQSNKTIVGIYAGFGAGTHLITRFISSPTFLTSSSPTNSSWGCISDTTGATSDTDGAANTNKIIAAGCGMTAAQSCRNLGADWYLPAREQLLVLYRNRVEMGMGENRYSIYWSSTEVAYNGADLLNFTNGSWGGYYGKAKNQSYSVLCVRNF
jgi:hypothetical protein